MQGGGGGGCMLLMSLGVLCTLTTIHYKRLTLFDIFITFGSQIKVCHMLTFTPEMI